MSEIATTEPTVEDRLLSLETEILAMRKDFEDIKTLLGEIKGAAEPLLNKLQTNPMFKMMFGE